MDKGQNKVKTLDTPWCSSLRGKTVLVTGASGLVGSAVVKLLLLANTREHCKIRVIANCRNGARCSELFGEYEEASVLVHDTLDVFPEDIHADYVIHAASPSHPVAFAKAPVEVICANVIGTKNVLDFAKNCDAKVLFVSTGEVYGPNPPDVPMLKEDYVGRIDSMLPRSCYPEGKRATENLCVSYSAEYGVSIVIARLCYVFGRDITDSNMRADAQFLRKALAKENIVLKSAGDQLRTYCYAPDAANAILHLLAFGASNEAYNVANRNCVITVREFAEALAKAAGVNLAFDLPSTEESKGFSKSQYSVLDPSKLERLGWEPKYRLEESMKDLLSDN